MPGNAYRSLAILSLVSALSGCPTPERDIAKSEKRLAIAKDLLAKRELEAAEAETNRALALNPSNEEAYNTRGLIWMVRAYETKRTLEIDSCLTGVDAEATHQDLEKFLAKADQDFAQAVKLTPDYGEAWSNRGVVYNLLEEYDRSAEYLTKALENPFRLVEPGLTRAHLGWALFHQNKLVEAAKELRQVKQFAGGMCTATYRLGRVYFARQEWEKAAELFETASGDPSCGSQESSLYLMKTRMEQGLVNDAIAARDACLKRSPQSCIASQCRADGGALGPSQVPSRP
ncbi:MAG: tetratricopeptide repeat protein [Kofleriaceae bacterium]|nr:tetratricopeptide repeat protein [Kofleriaceae bacterium]